VPFQRDPVSEWFDPGAADLLARAYRRPGQWTGTRVAPPRARHLAWAAARGINLLERDRTARSRWARAFIRSVGYINTWYVRDGKPGAQRRMARNPYGFRFRVSHGNARGWPVQIMIVPGGAAGYAKVPAAEAYVRNDALRVSSEDRDWPANG
jgi:hypothetical protein